jgi:hypothetical protein
MMAAKGLDASGSLGLIFARCKKRKEVGEKQEE